MRTIPILTLLFACKNPDKDPDTGTTVVVEPSSAIVDNDGDGFLSDEDCNDSDASINPNAPEVCDGTDNDCDDEVDEGVINTYYIDEDGDGFGHPSVSEEACSLPDGFATISTDCDDGDYDIYPGAPEVCDEIDNDCDDEIDEEGGGVLYPDADGDGYGDSSAPISGCSADEGYVEVGGDCNDNDDTIRPEANELCDGLDNDCDGDIDEDAFLTFYVDSDGDGFGSSALTEEACTPSEGYVENSTDCNDTRADTYPGAEELCDGIDNNCDAIPDAAASETTWYADVDGDGFGDPDSSLDYCGAPVGYVANSSDCDDTDSTQKPGATEICNGEDDDCDGSIDDGAGGLNNWYYDIDGDGYGDASTVVQACSQPSGTITDGSDCDDSDINQYPGAPEDCNGEDDDCDGAIDEGATSVAVYYADSDGDGYGNPADQISSCTPPSGYVSVSNDCDDGNADVNPGAVEVCNSLDDDCNALIDDSASDVLTWYADSDGDGYGDAAIVNQQCSQPTGYVADDTDCNDADSGQYPSAPEYCNNEDDDCNGIIDDNIQGNDTYYLDNDGDGFGDPNNSVEACGAPLGYVSEGQDCDDTDANVNPDAVEICNSVDDDCDGDVDLNASDAINYYIDNDGDGYGDNSTVELSCAQPSGYVVVGDDCDDTESAVYPNAIEVCNGIDDDCDGDIDLNASDAVNYYLDNDGDGFGASNTYQKTCTQPTGYVADDTDCNDTDAAISPTAAEICNSIDDDCNGSVDDSLSTAFYYLDNDGDGFGDANSSVEDCMQPTGYVSDDTDCNDTDNSLYPGAIEVCNNLDDDCNGTVDDSATDASIWYLDDDGDGYGDSSNLLLACDQPAGYVVDDTDCNDLDSGHYPGAPEYCNNEDDDCNGAIDDNTIGNDTYYLDSDGDGYGDPTSSTQACGAPTGYVSLATDCDDNDASISPAESEVCNSIDDDCNGSIDDNIAQNTYYADSDGDGYGDASSTIQDCAEPSGYVSDDSDCDDTQANTYPGADEYCNGVDEDCDGTIDNNAVNGVTVYEDADGDSFGDSNLSMISCSLDPGYSFVDGDCDDADNQQYPGADEYCNGEDDDCNGSIDDNPVALAVYYLDSDGDGFGDANSTTDSCAQPSGYVSDNTDCDDSLNTIYPGADEYCNGIDDDCDGANDNNPVDGVVYYADGDGDGYGDASTSDLYCTQPSGYVADDSDCDDTRATSNPAGIEICNQYDDDCNGLVDDNPTGLATYYFDSDGDGYGSLYFSAQSCSPPAGYIEEGGDCVDNDASINPGATEVCDGIDQDCSGVADDNGAGQDVYYADSDGDGYGDASSTQTACSQPSGYVSDDTDCNDGDSAINPAGAESAADGVDQNCDGQELCYVDVDGDTYGGTSTSLSTSLSCNASGVSLSSSDCNDGDSSINPAGVETAADGVDQNCDGLELCYADLDGDAYGGSSTTTSSSLLCSGNGVSLSSDDCNDGDSAINPAGVESAADGVDQNCDGQELCYADVDGDTYGGTSTTTSSSLSCNASGVSSASDDCNDGDSSINPAGVETAADGVDQNCDGLELCYADLDGDAYGVSTIISSSTLTCLGTGTATNSEDCNDGDPSINPSATEICDLIDNNCDSSDDILPSTWYVDADGDGFGNDNISQDSCTTIGGYVSDNTDCDDTSAAVNPDAIEDCNGIDDDCDSLIDDDDPSLESSIVWYADADADGYGDPLVFLAVCEQPSGYVDNADDCDDNDADDCDSDGIQNCLDEDDDDDGIPDIIDGAPCDPFVLEPPTGGTGGDGDLEVDGVYVFDELALLDGVGVLGLYDIDVDDATPFSPMDEILILSQVGADAGLWETAYIESININTLTLYRPLQNNYSVASTVLVQRIPQFGAVSVPLGSTMTAVEWQGDGGGVIIFRATGQVDIDGTLDVSELGYNGGGGALGASTDGEQGESYVGGGATGVSSANYGGGGSAGKQNGRANCGGGGGYGDSGTAGTNRQGNPASDGGEVYGTSSLVTWYMGSGGGAGAPDNTSTFSDVSGDGGDGAGIITIWSEGDINITGLVLANGENGEDGVSGSGAKVGGGGGGAGGQIFLVAPNISVLSTATLEALGGGGGKSAAGSVLPYQQARGGIGGEGRIRIESNTFSGASDPAASTGAYTEY